MSFSRRPVARVVNPANNDKTIAGRTTRTEYKCKKAPRRVRLSVCGGSFYRKSALSFALSHSNPCHVFFVAKWWMQEFCFFFYRLWPSTFGSGLLERYSSLLRRPLSYRFNVLPHRCTGNRRRGVCRRRTTRSCLRDERLRTCDTSETNK